MTAQSLPARPSLPDEELLVLHLADLKGQAWNCKMAAKTQHDPAIKAAMNALAEDSLERARALHRLLERNGIVECGYLNY